MTAIITALVLISGLPLAGPVAYRLLLAVATFFYRSHPVESGSPARIAVLVPAHNEAGVIDRCVRSLTAQRYPLDRYQVVVVADNCTDATAEVARSAGALVMVRVDPLARGKGRALSWAIDRLLSNPQPPDAVVVVDADSIADGDFLRELEAQRAAGHHVVQGEYLLRVVEGSPRRALEAAALLLHHRVRFRGRAVLRMPATLSGNGMLFSRQVLSRYPWDAFTSIEDAEYSMTLRLRGVTVAYAAAARIDAEATPDDAAAFAQGLRWEGGRFLMIRTWLGRFIWAIIRHGRWDLADFVLELASPPLGVLAMATVGGGLLAALLVVAGVAAPLALLPWAAALVGLPAYVLLGLLAARAPRAVYRALLFTPLFLVRKLVVLRRLAQGVDLTQWVRPGSGGTAV